jgi:hypothetical protein
MPTVHPQVQKARDLMPLSAAAAVALSGAWEALYSAAISPSKRCK